MKTLRTIAGALLVVGGLNWGLVGAADFDLVAAVLGEMTLLSRTVYVAVGLAAITLLLTLRAEPQGAPVRARG